MHNKTLFNWRENIRRSTVLGLDIDFSINERIKYAANAIAERAEMISKLTKQIQSQPPEIYRIMAQSRIEFLEQEQNKLYNEIIQIQKFRKSRYLPQSKQAIDVDKIRSEVKIIDLVSPIYIRGAKALCFSPLRDDGRKPSFSVDNDKNLWFDFVLGEGGDVIKLYMLMNNCDFRTAIKELNELV